MQLALEATAWRAGVPAACSRCRWPILLWATKQWRSPTCLQRSVAIMCNVTEVRAAHAQEIFEGSGCRDATAKDLLLS